jgi:hypothetical protein
VNIANKTKQFAKDSLSFCKPINGLLLRVNIFLTTIKVELLLISISMSILISISMYIPIPISDVNFSVKIRSCGCIKLFVAILKHLAAQPSQLYSALQVILKYF